MTLSVRAWDFCWLRLGQLEPLGREQLKRVRLHGVGPCGCGGRGNGVLPVEVTHVDIRGEQRHVWPRQRARLEARPVDGAEVRLRLQLAEAAARTETGAPPASWSAACARRR